MMAAKLWRCIGGCLCGDLKWQIKLMVSSMYLGVLYSNQIYLYGNQIKRGDGVRKAVENREMSMCDVTLRLQLKMHQEMIFDTIQL